MYQGYLSSFDPIIVFIRGTVDPSDSVAVALVKETVDAMLAERVREETVGQGDLRVDFARQRIDGSINVLVDSRRLAKKAGALPEFIAIIDAVLVEARAAYERAPGRPSTPVAELRPAPWTIERSDSSQSVGVPDDLFDGI